MRRVVGGLVLASALGLGPVRAHAQEHRRAVDDDTAFLAEAGGGLFAYSLPAALVLWGLTSDDPDAVAGIVAFGALTAPLAWMAGTGGAGAALGGNGNWFGVLLGGTVGLVGALIVTAGVAGICQATEEHDCFSRPIPFAALLAAWGLLPPLFAAITYEANNDIPGPPD
jgi:hypothetical protein